MVFSDTINDSGIVEDIDFILGTDATRFPLKDKARLANMAQDSALSLILGSDGRWQFDDTNNTDFPIATTDLVSGQQDYGFTTDMLVVTRIEAKDANGKWVGLTPIDQNDLNQGSYGYQSNTVNGISTDRQSLTAFMDTNGNPIYYDKIANSIFLYPAPNYNSTDGLKVYFQRKMDDFVAADTTKVPGFASHLHRYVSYFAARDYAAKKGMSMLGFLENKVKEWGQAIVEHYGYRPKDESVKIKPNVENYR